MRVACFFTRPFPRGLCPPSEPPPFRHWASAFALGAAGPHLSHLSVTPRLVTSYTAPLGSVRLVHRGWSYGLTWVSPDLGFASPHPVPVLYHSRSGLSRVFLRSFYEAPQLVLGRSPAARSAHNHSGVPLLGYRGRPSEGLGFASPPDNDILPYPLWDWNRLSGKVFHHFLHPRGPAEAGFLRGPGPAGPSSGRIFRARAGPPAGGSWACDYSQAA